MEFDYDGGGLGKGGTVSLYLDGEKTGEGRVEGTVPTIFSATRPATSAPTRPRLSATTTPSQGSRFTGTVEWVQIDVAEAAENLDHLISPEDRLKIAMARQ